MIGRPGLVGLVLALAVCGQARAQFQPIHAVEVVVNGTPGSPNDMFAHALASIVEQDKLAPVRFQVVDKPGGGSATAASYVMSRRGDPYVLACFTNIWISDPLVQLAAKNRLIDMTPIARLVVEPALVVVRADSPYGTMADFVAAARKTPGQLKQSGGSVTSRENIVRQLLMKASGARWSFISLPSGAERVAALLGGNVDMMIADPSAAPEHMRTDKLRTIAQVNERRLPGLPDVPTLTQAGFDIPDLPQMRGVLGAPAMPPDAAAYYEELFAKLSKTPKWQQFVDDGQLDNTFMGTADLNAFLATFEGELRDVLKDSGTKVVR